MEVNMKEIKAYIREHKLTPVILALHQIEGLTGVSIYEIRGYGRGKAQQAENRIIQDLISYIPMIRIDIVCLDNLVDRVVTAIQQAAHTGNRGDGKIYIANIEQAVRISTDERGEKAV